MPSTRRRQGEPREGRDRGPAWRAAAGTSTRHRPCDPAGSDRSTSQAAAVPIASAPRRHRDGQRQRVQPAGSPRRGGTAACRGAARSRRKPPATPHRRAAAAPGATTTAMGTQSQRGGAEEPRRPKDGCSEGRVGHQLMPTACSSFSAEEASPISAAVMERRLGLVEALQGHGGHDARVQRARRRPLRRGSSGPRRSPRRRQTSRPRPCGARLSGCRGPTRSAGRRGRLPPI